MKVMKRSGYSIKQTYQIILLGVRSGLHYALLSDIKFIFDNKSINVEKLMLCTILLQKQLYTQRICSVIVCSN